MTGPCGFDSSLRLVSPEQFKVVFRKGRRHHGQGLTVLVQPNGLDHPRLGTAIAKKKTRTAIQRNRIKRVIKESFRQHQRLFAGFDIVVLARDGVTGLNNAALFSELSEHWQRIATP